jgi:hypothetical protein
MTTLRTFAGASRLTFRAFLSMAAFAALTPTSGWALTTAPTQAPDSVVSSRNTAPVLKVENNNWMDVDVYLVRNGEPFPLGTVSGPGEGHLVLPSLATTPGAQVQILVLPIGGADDYLSPTLLVNPGDVLHLTVENSLDLSSVSVAPAS